MVYSIDPGASTIGPDLVIHNVTEVVVAVDARSARHLHNLGVHPVDRRNPKRTASSEAGQIVGLPARPVEVLKVVADGCGQVGVVKVPLTGDISDAATTGDDREGPVIGETLGRARIVAVNQSDLIGDGGTVRIRVVKNRGQFAGFGHGIGGYHASVEGKLDGPGVHLQIVIAQNDLNRRRSGETRAAWNGDTSAINGSRRTVLTR